MIKMDGGDGDAYYYKQLAEVSSIVSIFFLTDYGCDN